MQAMGAAGLHQEHPLARHLACAKAAQYMDGATEIQNVVLGRHLQSRYGTPDA
jgi:alkylation response protein AidB-like acyl-CoA dehydrogenase